MSLRSKSGTALVCAMVLVLASASTASAKTCANGKNSNGAMWLSILHPGVGEWSLNGWGSFNQNVPKRKFWFGFIPGFGFPYLSVVSAIDVANCRTDDGLGWN